MPRSWYFNEININEIICRSKDMAAALKGTYDVF